VSAIELLSHPAFQVWAAATVPFACRFAAAWTVWLRVQGLWSPVIGDPRHRIPSGRGRSTTDPVVAGLWWVIATLGATVVVGPLRSVIDEVGAALPIPSLLLALSVAASLVWLFRRIHADDIAWREFREKAPKPETIDLG
jgi:hypothetical protein